MSMKALATFAIKVAVCVAIINRVPQAKAIVYGN